MSSNKQTGHLIIVSNRLPIVIRKDGDELSVQPGSGGLVTALAPVLRNRGGIWIGWPGTYDNGNPRIDVLIDEAKNMAGFSFHPVRLTQEEVELYYYGFSNESIWPLFHDLQSRCRFDQGYWDAYEQVNRKFAEVVVHHASAEDYIWVHDYQLMLAGSELRRLGISSRLGFFLHIPFPTPDIFVKLPWRFQILKGLLEFDLIGFQTLRDRRNFVQCVKALIDDVEVETLATLSLLHVGSRTIRVGSFPISIDVADFVKRASSPEVERAARAIQSNLPHRTLILGVDRLDYTKGLPERLEAFRLFLRQHPDLHGKVTFIQIVVPSRVYIPKYQDLKTEVERLVGEINGEFSHSGWTPIIYMFRHLNRRELLAYYRASGIALLTPIKDGMNLVAKEYCTTCIDDDGVLILREFAGSAAQLQRYAILVNPYDLNQVADAIYRAMTMPDDERRKRMRNMRRSIRRQDVFWWLESFLSGASAKALVDFPVVEDYAPTSSIVQESISL
jgi:alpha,alpha-trehalose-phosphate synthase [UDP-forming]